jgi:hypothetical protein
MIEVLAAIAVAGGVAIGRWVAKRHKADVPADAPPEPAKSTAPPAGPTPEEIALEEELTGSPREEAGEPVDWGAFPCALGDVVLRNTDHAEAWLGGAIVLREDAPAAVLFIAPDASGERAIYVRARPRAELSWLSPVPRPALAVLAEPPSAIELDGVRFERGRRLPLRAQRVGTGAPDVAGTVIVGEYGSAAGEVAVVVVAEGVTRAWRGRVLGEGEYDVWKSDDARARR